MEGLVSPGARRGEFGGDRPRAWSGKLIKGGSSWEGDGIVPKETGTGDLVEGAPMLWGNGGMVLG